MSWVEWLLLPVVGCLGGFLAGLLGVGGGMIFIPVLTTLFLRQGISGEETVRFTLANSILLVFISGVSGIYRQRKMGVWEWQKALSIGIPGAIVSSALTYLIQHGDWYQKENFQIVFLGFLCLSIIHMLFSKKNENGTTETGISSIISWKELLVGSLAGAVVALSGLGGGVIMVPLFRMLLKMPMKKATALSLSVIPLLSITPIIGYLFKDIQSHISILHTGYLVWPYVLPMALGVVIFASFGLKTAQHMPVHRLRIIFAVLSIIVFIKTVYEIINHV